MQELNMVEVEEVSGAGIFYSIGYAVGYMLGGGGGNRRPVEETDNTGYAWG